MRLEDSAAKSLPSPTKVSALATLSLRGMNGRVGAAVQATRVHWWLG